MFYGLGILMMETWQELKVTVKREGEELVSNLLTIIMTSKMGFSLLRQNYGKRSFFIVQGIAAELLTIILHCDLTE